MSTDLATIQAAFRVHRALNDLILAHAVNAPKERLSAASAALAVGATYDQVRAAMGGMSLDAAFMRYARSL